MKNATFSRAVRPLPMLLTGALLSLGSCGMLSSSDDAPAPEALVLEPVEVPVEEPAPVEPALPELTEAEQSQAELALAEETAASDHAASMRAALRKALGQPDEEIDGLEPTAETGELAADDTTATDEPATDEPAMEAEAAGDEIVDSEIAAAEETLDQEEDELDEASSEALTDLDEQLAIDQIDGEVDEADEPNFAEVEPPVQRVITAEEILQIEMANAANEMYELELDGAYFDEPEVEEVADEPVAEEGEQTADAEVLEGSDALETSEVAELSEQGEVAELVEPGELAELGEPEGESEFVPDPSTEDELANLEGDADASNDGPENLLVVVEELASADDQPGSGDVIAFENGLAPDGEQLDTEQVEVAELTEAEQQELAELAAWADDEAEFVDELADANQELASTEEEPAGLDEQLLDLPEGTVLEEPGSEDQVAAVGELETTIDIVDDQVAPQVEAFDPLAAELVWETVNYAEVNAALAAAEVPADGQTPDQISQIDGENPDAPDVLSIEPIEQPGIATAFEPEVNPFDFIQSLTIEQRVALGPLCVFDPSGGLAFMTHNFGNLAGTTNSYAAGPPGDPALEGLTRIDGSEFNPVVVQPGEVINDPNLGMIWWSEAVPEAQVDSILEIQTPSVGRVRLVMHSGDYVEGIMHSVGKGQYWIDGDIGRFAMRADLISHIERLPKPGLGQEIKGLQAGDLVRVKLKTGSIEGRLISMKNDQALVETVTGMRITLPNADVEPVGKSQTRVVIN